MKPRIFAVSRGLAKLKFDDKNIKAIHDLENKISCKSLKI